MSLKTKLRNLLPNWLVNTFWHLPKAVLANLVYGFPSGNLTIIGITGTSGKTTTCHLIYHLLDAAGFKVALISSVAARIGRKTLETGLHVTNPDPFPLQKLLKLIAQKGFTHVVLEVTSHGLDQHRCWGVKFDYGVLLNIRHEHLDYHRTWSKYQKAKLKLICQSRTAVINRQDPSAALAKKLAKAQVIEFYASQVKTLPKTLIGEFNRENLAAAQAVAQDLGMSQGQINSALQNFPGIPGRMELVFNQDFKVVIDFAHKPDALERALQSLKNLKGKSGRLISVFGCAGLRDVQKRPMMGEISARLAELTILTAEDPRTEDVNAIIDQIAAGCRQAGGQEGKDFLRIPDRQEAINQAISLAKPTDVVALFGKAHEKSMCFGTIESSWSEHQAVKKALKLRRQR